LDHSKNEIRTDFLTEMATELKQKEAEDELSMSGVLKSERHDLCVQDVCANEMAEINSRSGRVWVQPNF
jgi:hypothetical protein